MSGLKTKFNLSPSYLIHKSSNHNFLSCFFLYTDIYINYNSVKIFHKDTNTTQNTSCFLEHTNVSRKVKIILTITKCKSRDTITYVFKTVHIPQALNKGNCVNCLWWAGWPILLRGPTQGPVLATANTGKTKNAGEWTGRVEISKEEISGSRGSMHGCILTYSRLYSENLWAMGSQKWVFNFCVRSTPLRVR